MKRQDTNPFENHVAHYESERLEAFLNTLHVTKRFDSTLVSSETPGNDMAATARPSTQSDTRSRPRFTLLPTETDKMYDQVQYQAQNAHKTTVKKLLGLINPILRIGTFLTALVAGASVIAMLFVWIYVQSVKVDVTAEDVEQSKTICAVLELPFAGMWTPTLYYSLACDRFAVTQHPTQP